MKFIILFSLISSLFMPVFSEGHKKYNKMKKRRKIVIQLKQMFRKKEEIEPVICDINIEAKIADLPVSLIRTSILLIN